ncbi:MAG: hypothetical protein M5R40_06695 [Anaerolineae bacterium]|nr:hypothetical protein [Anaerolineae bacterium]
MGGGLPRGALTEVVSAPTAGAGTLALKAIAAAHALGEAAAYLDLAAAFDPAYAARCGVALDRLLVIRPQPCAQAAPILRDLVTGGGAGVVVLDGVETLLRAPGGAVALAEALPALRGALARSDTVLLCLTRHADAAATDTALPPSHAALRLHLAWCGWLRAWDDVAGYWTAATVLKHRYGPAGVTVTVAVRFDGVVDGDGA